MVTTATPSVFVSWTNSLIIPFRSTSYNRISGERDANFLRNSAKLFNDRHDQGHAVFTAHSLRFTPGITGNKLTISARRGLRSTKCADEMVDLFFFSSRRRHTSWTCDWSSDVCSSDLGWSAWNSAPFPTAKPAPRFAHASS